MGYVRHRSGVKSRRAFLLAWPVLRLAGASRRGATYPSEAETYIDAEAEFEVTRLTDSAFRSRLPGGHSRFIAARRDFLIYPSERSGSFQVFRLDLATGRHRQLTEAETLNVDSLALLDNDGAFVYFDGRGLFGANTNGGRPRPIYSLGEGATLEGGVATGDDDTGALIEWRGGGSRIQVVDLRRGGTVWMLDLTVPATTPMPRPGSRSLVYRSTAGLWLAEYSGGEPRPVPTVPGLVGPARWDSGGRRLYYLRLDGEDGRRNQLREILPESDEDRLVAETAGFVGFAVNSSGDVFAGIRDQESGAVVVLLLRTGAELTICQHGGSNPEQAALAFSPDGQRLYFESDRDGSSALYSIELEGLVEPTPI